jgi:hypothetical protein
MPDVQTAPLVAHRLLEAGLQLIAVRGLDREESQHGVLKRRCPASALSGKSTGWPYRTTMSICGP